MGISPSLDLHPKGCGKFILGSPYYNGKLGKEEIAK
jgi:hypothetical protein